jgi:hypothetical protein
MARKAAIITTVIRLPIGQRAFRIAQSVSCSALMLGISNPYFSEVCRIATRGHAGCGGRKARVSRRQIPFKRFTATAGQFRRDLHKYPARVSHRNKDHHDKARLHLWTERSLAYGHKHLRHFDNIHIYKLMAHIALVIALVLKQATEPPLRSQQMFFSYCWPLLSGIEPIHQNLFNERRQCKRRTIDSTPACVSFSNSLTPRQANCGPSSSRRAERSSAAERKPRLPQSTRYAGRHPSGFPVAALIAWIACGRV